MKLNLIPALTILFVALTVASYGESAYERDLNQLVEQRDKTLAAATAPITARFKASAEQLLRRATQAGDLDAANKINAALAELGVAGVTDTPKSPLQSLMDGSRWEWFNSPEPIGKARNWVEFYKDGEGNSGWGAPLRYTVTGPNTLKVSIGVADGTCFFVVDTAKKIARHDPGAGAGQPPRSMVFEKRVSSTNPNK